MWQFVALEALPAGDPLTFFLNFGTLGVIFILLLTGWLYTKPYVTRLEKELASKDQLLETFRTQISMHTIPALAQTARIMEAVPSSEAMLAEEIRQLRSQVSSLLEQQAAR